MAAYTTEDKAEIVRRADAGETWEAIGQALGRSSTAVEHAAHRMRKRGEWPRNSRSARLPPDGPGRPRNRVATTAVSVRVSAEVEVALRDVAARAGLGNRVGTVLTEAITRAVARADDTELPALSVKRLSSKSRAADRRLVSAPRSRTVSVCVDAQALADLVRRNPTLAPTGVVGDAAERLLQDLGYVLVDAQ